MASMIMNRTWATTIKPKRLVASPITFICPIDFTEQATVALRCASQLARQRRGRLLLVHVIARGPSDNQGDDSGCELALSRLQQVAPMMPGLACDFVVLQGAVCDQILELASGCETPQIVMATRRRTDQSRELIGRTAEEVLRRAACPVVIVTNEDILETNDKNLPQGRRIAHSPECGKAAIH
jgi:nucleotide-binding universal stress UspA family protein